MKKNNLILTILICLVILSIIISPQKFITAGLNGISAWAFNVLPSVLPFMIFTKLLFELSYIEKLTKPLSKPFKKLYGTSPISGFVFFMSVLSGYPVGSKMIADLYESNKISKQDALKMSSFCSNSGPMFIVGSVGSLMLGSVTAGYIILISHILSALLNGIIYRKIKLKDEQNSIKTLEEKSQSFGDIILSATQSIISVGGVICLFFIIIEFFSPIISLFPSSLRPLIEGSIEITRGCLNLKTFPLKTATIFASIIITFGGFSTIMQSIAMLKKVKISVFIFTLMKFTQCVFAGIISFILVNLIAI